MSRSPPDSITISTASRLPSPYIFGISNVPESSFITREPPLPIVRVGWFPDSSLKISLEPSRTTEQPSILISPANTIVAPMNSYTPLLSTAANVSLPAIQAQSITASSKVTGGDCSLMSA